MCVHGPNGFFRELRGATDDPAVTMELATARAGGENIVLRCSNQDAARAFSLRIEDAGYGAKERVVTLEKGGRAEVVLETSSGRGWYDWRIQIEGAPKWTRRYAGRIETGKEGVTDPVMGGERGSRV